MKFINLTYMTMKVKVFGHHEKSGYIMINDFSKLKLSKLIKYYRSWKSVTNSKIPIDYLGRKPYCTQWSEYVNDRPKNRKLKHKVILFNSVVYFQYMTGSVLGVKFPDRNSAIDYMIWLGFNSIQISEGDPNKPYQYGDEIKFNQEVIGKSGIKYTMDRDYYFYDYVGNNKFMILPEDGFNLIHKPIKNYPWAREYMDDKLELKIIL